MKGNHESHVRELKKPGVDQQEGDEKDGKKN